MPLDVASKEGRCSVKVADVKDFWSPDIGKDHIEVLDPNITACREKHDLFQQYADTGVGVCFNQGLDIRMITARDIEDLNKIRLQKVHFAWDNPQDNLKQKFEDYAKGARWKYKGSYGMVYILTNYNSTMEENLFRIHTVADLGFDPYVMVYDKPHAPKEIRRLQRWCNNKVIFKTVRRFEDYI